MKVDAEPRTLQTLRAALSCFDAGSTPVARLRSLLRDGLAELPLPGSGATLRRWQALAAVAARDLSLAKLYEGHTDALAILAELGEPPDNGGNAWGTWAAEAPGGRMLIDTTHGRSVVLSGAKCWCSGAADLDHGLLTAWFADGRGPQLVRVPMRQPGVTVHTAAWQAVGMAGSASVDLRFVNAHGELVGGLGDYLSRPGFWQGGAGIAACWYGAAASLGAALHRSLTRAEPERRHAFQLAALGKVDLSLQATAAVLRDAARWIDEHPRGDASSVALRARLAAETCATRVLDEVGRALGSGAFCRDAHFARMAADLPVFIRQCHAERDFAALAERLLQHEEAPWAL
jgi:hypothetical protein